MKNSFYESDNYTNFVRLVSAVGAIFVWLVSIRFSSDGFNIEAPGYAWVGVGLGIFVTILQLVWNEGAYKKNITLAVVCLLSYGYSIFTNLIGLMFAMNISQEMAANDPARIIFPLALSIILDISPEPLFIWAVGANGDGTRDTLGNVLRLFDRGEGRKGRGPGRPRKDDIRERKHSGKTGFGGNLFNPFSDDEERDIDLSTLLGEPEDNKRRGNKKRRITDF